MSETFLIRTKGGPHPGTRGSPGPWPLPTTLPDDAEAEYVKVQESKLPEAFPGIVRGALYEWRAARSIEGEPK
jgi:hypothetical protein